MAPLPSQRALLSIEADDRYEFVQLPPLSAKVPSHALNRIRERAVSPRPSPFRQFPLFSNTSPRQCEEIVGAARHRELSRGQTIQIEGDSVRHVILLTSGSAKVVQFGRNGTEVILRLCGPGELVGTLGLCTEGRHCATARVLRPSAALVWEIDVFDSLSRRFPALRLNTAIIFANQLRDIEDRFFEISTCPVASRLSRQIVRLMSQVGHQCNRGVEISISREELAQLVGTTLFTVSRLLSDWDRRGIVVARRGAVSVLDFKALEHLSEDVSQIPAKQMVPN